MHHPDQKGGTIADILGQPDDQKFRSSMTVFEAVSGDPVFMAAIQRNSRKT
jgi:uncharacterized protein (DUF1810 family)